MVSTSISLDDEQKVLLDKIAKLTKKSRSEVIREAITLFCDQFIADMKETKVSKRGVKNE